MLIIRYLAPGSRSVSIGVSDGSFVRSLESVTSIGELLSHRKDDVRQLCLGASGSQLPEQSVRLLPPVDGQMEVWAAGVTYQVSKSERIRESAAAASVYELVYDAARPELFFKSAAWRVCGSGEYVGIREDSTIDVPEPELALVVNQYAEVVGYTVCNDLSSRSIEGENPLYLPQAKIYLGSCSIASGIRPAWEVAEPNQLTLELTIGRQGRVVWHGEASTSQLIRTLDQLVGYLFAADAFPQGVLLSTGTCLVPSLPFTLAAGDVVTISIDTIGSLINAVVRGKEQMQWLVAARDDPWRRPQIAHGLNMELADNK